MHLVRAIALQGQDRLQRRRVRGAAVRLAFSAVAAAAQGAALVQGEELDGGVLGEQRGAGRGRIGEARRALRKGRQREGRLVEPARKDE